jgi:hypothetical protein
MGYEYFFEGKLERRRLFDNIIPHGTVILD